jgi:hypothetical protein
MDPVEQRLTDAGDAWRRSQRPPTEIGGFARPPAPRTWVTPVRAVVGLAAAFALVAGAIVVAPRAQQGGQLPPPTDSPKVAVATTPLATPAPTPIVAPGETPLLIDFGDRYADGIPRTIGGQHVYRPSEVLKNEPDGEFLLGGWDAGSLTVSCPIQKTVITLPCPHFEGLAEVRDGPSVLPLTWDAYRPSTFPAFVVRAVANPAVACLSNPPGACPGPSATVHEVLWMGEPGTSPALGAWPPIVCGRLSADACGLVESLVVSWLGSDLPSNATVITDSGCLPGAFCALGFDAVAVVLVPGSPPRVGVVLRLRGLSYPDTLFEVSPTAIPSHIRALIPREVPLPS